MRGRPSNQLGTMPRVFVLPHLLLAQFPIILRSVLLSSPWAAQHPSWWVVVYTSSEKHATSGTPWCHWKWCFGPGCLFQWCKEVLMKPFSLAGCNRKSSNSALSKTSASFEIEEADVTYYCSVGCTSLPLSSKGREDDNFRMAGELGQPEVAWISYDFGDVCCFWL